MNELDVVNNGGCCVCGIVFHNRLSASRHMEERVHKYQLDRLVKGKLGVYVHRYDIGRISDHEITSIFSKCGQVSWIRRPPAVMDVPLASRNYCIVYFADFAATVMALQMNFFLRNKPLLVSAERIDWKEFGRMFHNSNKEMQQRQQAHSLMDGRQPPQIQQNHHHHQNNVVSANENYSGKDYGQSQQNPRECEQIRSRQQQQDWNKIQQEAHQQQQQQHHHHNHSNRYNENGQRASVDKKPHTKFNSPKKERWDRVMMRNKNDNKLDFVTFPDSLDGKSFDEIAGLFVRLAEAGPDHGLKQKLVCSDLETTFREELPGVKACMFGSSVTGLAFKESDFDIFMECPNGQPGRNFVEKNTKVMNLERNKYHRLVRIANARVPIVKFVHDRTGMSCDVNFTNKLGVMNSQLIRFMLSLDDRLRPFFMVVKYWGRVMELTEVGKFSNYALVMMGIYYLQQMDPPILPPIKLLQDLPHSRDDPGCETLFWDCTFCSDPTLVPKNENRSSLKQLLQGFYDFYVDFDYENHVICPLLGTKLHRDLFKDISELPDSLNLYKNYVKGLQKDVKPSLLHNGKVPICVQDPFDLDYNITRSVRINLLFRFAWLCQYLVEHVFNKCSEWNLLPTLFSEPTIPEPKIIQYKDTFKLEIPIDQIPLPNSEDTDGYRLHWFRTMTDITVTVLSRVYLFRLTFYEEKKVQKMEDDTDVKSGLFNSIRNRQFLCEGSVTVCTGRKIAEKKLTSPVLDDFEKECQLSEVIRDTGPKHYRRFRASAKLFCLLENTPRFCIVFSDVGWRKRNLFKGLTQWMETNFTQQCKLAVKSMVYKASGTQPTDLALEVNSVVKTETPIPLLHVASLSPTKKNRYKKKKNKSNKSNVLVISMKTDGTEVEPAAKLMRAIESVANHHPGQVNSGAL